MEFGKFKDATSLFEGYINLEKAYTKKCQEAKELKSKLEISENLKGVDEQSFKTSTFKNEDGKVEAILSDECSVCEGFDTQKSCSDAGSEPLKSDEKSEIGMENVEIYNTKSDEIGLDKNKKDDIENRENSCSERFKRPEWRKSVAKFFAEYPDAKPLKEKIAKEILSDKALQKADNCLEIAYERITNNRPASAWVKKSESEQPENSQAQKNAEVDPNKEITLSEYLKLVAERKVSAPKFLTDAVGSRAIGLTPKMKISSIAEAGEYLMKNYFK